MPRETVKAKSARLKKIIAALDRTYPDARFDFASAHFSARLFP
jgi:hypothetical protein